MTELAQVNQETAQPALPADPMVSMIERVAMSPDLPIERLEKMMDLKDRHDENQRRNRAEDAERAYNCAMSKAQAAMPTVVRTKRNDHTRSTYADLSDIEEQAMPIAYKHGFSVSFTPAGKDQSGNLLIDWCLMHEGGHTRTGQAGFPLDGAGAQGKTNKTGIQAMGSTMTYGRRYLICNLFNIATDDDNDGNNDAANKKQPQYSWADTVTQDLPENATARDKAEAIAAALASQFRRMKGVQQIDNEWDRRATLIGGLEDKHRDLWGDVIEAYDTRRHELAEAAAEKEAGRANA